MTSLIPTLAFFGIGPLGGAEVVVLAILGVLIFGKRLPEVGRSIGKGIVEFKKGLSGIEEEMDRSEPTPPRIEHRPSAKVDTTASHPEAASTTTATSETPTHPA